MTNTINLEEIMQQLISKYSDKYEILPKFRSTVNEALPVGRFKQMYLGTARRLGFKNYCRASVETIVTRYIRKLLDEQPEVAGMSAEIMQQLQTYMSTLTQLKEAQEAAEQHRTRAETTANEQQQEEQRIKHDAERLRFIGEQTLREEKGRIDETKKKELEQLKQDQATKVKEDVRKGLEEQVSQSGIVEIISDTIEIRGMKPESRMQYNDTALVNRLGDIFLEEILDKVNARNPGLRAHLEGHGVDFMDKGRLQDEAEVSRIDAIGSVVNARTHGQRKISPEYAIVRKAFSEGSTDAVVCVDISGSMNDYNRIQMAIHTGLALGAMLEKQNPQNLTKYVVFGASRVVEVNRTEFYKIRAAGDTPMAPAIEKSRTILEEGKGEQKILYLVSDGYPNVGDVVESARKFGEQHNYYLRMILIGVERESIENVKSITDAAGKNSRVLPVRHDKVDIAVFEDYLNLFNGLTTGDRLEDYL